jgi:hypothetical protein
MTTRLMLFALIFLGLGQTTGFAQVLYNYSNESDGSPSFTAANTVGTNVALGSGSMPVVSAAPPCGPTQGFGSEGWPATNVFNVNTFESNGWYVGFSITPDMGYGLKITGFSTRSRRENVTGVDNDGPIAMRYGYSTDGGINWTTINPGNPQSSNLCASGGVQRIWNGFGTVNTSNPILFRIYGLSSGANLTGDFYLRDIVVNGEVCANAPTIVLGTVPEYCFSTSATTATIPYSASTGTEYRIVIPGLGINTAYAALPASPITYTIPAGTLAGDYVGTVTVRNGCGFESTPVPFTTVVNSLPSATVMVDETTICATESINITFNETAYPGGTEFTVSTTFDDNGGPNPIIFTDVVNTNSLGVTEGSDFNGTLTVGTITVVNEDNGCQSTTPGFVVNVNPLPVGTISITDDSGFANDGIVCTGGSVTLTVSGGIHYEWSTGETPAQITVSPVSSTTYTVTVTSADLCTATQTVTVTVSPLPDAGLSVMPSGAICPGTAIEIFFEDFSSYPPGTEYTIGANVSPMVFGQDSLTLYEVIDGDHIDLLEGTDFTGTLSISNIVVTEDVSGCSSTVADFTIEVLPAPEFGFTAQTDSDGPYSGNNTAGPNTLNVDFCAGDHLTLSGYTDNGAVGYTYFFTTTGNVNYDGGPAYPLASGPVNVDADDAADFFDMVYGGALGYGLTSDTIGMLNQVFVPYLDNDNSGSFTAGDCIGDTMFLNYTIYAIPTVTVTQASTEFCNGETATASFSGNYLSGASYSWTNDNPSVGLAASGTGAISFTATNTGTNSIVATITVTPSANGCEGDPEVFTITVHPQPVVNNLTATVNGGTPQSVNNAGGPTSMTLNFCEGESFTFSDYSGTANLGFLAEIVDGTSNLLYDVTPIDVPSTVTDITPAGVAGFFGGTFGPYNLAGGDTEGWIEQVFTPYFDANNNGSFDTLDCTGAPFTVFYRVYAPIDLNITRTTPGSICSGDLVEYTFSTTSAQDVTFDLVFEPNVNGANPADLTDDNIFPAPSTHTINSSTPYTFSTTVNNAVGTFDRGRVRVRATNIAYANVDVCTTADVNGQNTQVYPTPSLAPVSPLLSCNGNTLELDIDALNSSMNPNAAGFPLRIEWVLSAPGLDEDGATGTTVIYDNAGIELNGGIDISQILTLSDPMNGPQTATFTITPRASGPSNAFNGDDCYGDPITVEVTVVPAAIPVIEGPSCMHIGTVVQLSGYDNVVLPATFVSGEWADNGSGNASVDSFGIVTGIDTGSTTIFYLVTDNAGCVSTASHVINVLEGLTLTSSYTGGPVSCGEEFTVSVAVDGFCDIGTLDYQFSWDPSVFQFVTFTQTPIPGGVPFVSTNNIANGQLIYLFYADVPPFGSSLPDSTVILTYTLRAIGNSGIHNVPATVEVEEAYNSNFSVINTNTFGVSVQIQPLSLDLGMNPVVCPNDDFAILSFSNVSTNANYYVIDFDAAAEAAGFPNIQQGDLVVMDGFIQIPLPNGLQNGSYQATLVISDTDSGCESDVYLFSIIVDQIAPIVPTPAALNLECVTSIPAPNPAVVVGATDNCTAPEDLDIQFEENLSSQTGTGCASDPMIIVRVYSVTDEAGNVAFTTHLITVEDDVPPVISTTGLAAWYPSGQAAIAAALARANATKVDGNSCTPAVGINVALGAVDTAGCVGTITLIVTDACGNLTPAMNATYIVTIDREDPVVTAGVIDDCYDAAPATDPYGQYTFAVNAALLATTATDDCDVSLNIDVLITGTDCETFITITATDDCGKSASVTYDTRVENDAPIISTDPLTFDGACFNNEADALNAAIMATLAGDDCTPPEDLQLAAYASSGCPAEITVEVTDFCGNFSTIVYTGVLIDTEDPMVAPAVQYATCFKTFTEAFDSLARAANPSDNCTSLADLLASVQTSSEEVGVFEDFCDEYDLSFTFFDNCGNEVTYTFPSIIIDNVAPTAMPLAALNFTCLDDVDAPDSLLVVATDNCGVEDVIHVSTVLPTTCPGTGTRTYRVFDCAGNSVDVIQVITIDDNVAPTWVTTPANFLDRTISCEDTSSISNALSLVPEAEDNCGEVTVTLNSVTPLSSCAGGFVRTWTAVDDCGNVAATLFTQTITIVDNVAPTWVNLAGTLDASVECSDAAALAAANALAPVASDNCTGYTLSKTAGVFVPGMSCPQEGTYTNTWVATDGCGNASTMFTQVITVTDNNAPTWVTPEGVAFPEGLDLTISCTDVAGYNFANSLAPVASDLCDQNPSLSKTTGAFVPGGGCAGEGSFTNTWTASDSCGNVSVMFTQTITVVDNTPPTFNPVCQFMPLNLTTSFGTACPADATITGLTVGQEIDEAYSWNVAGFNVPVLAGCIFDDCVPTSDIIVKVVSIDNVYDSLACSRTFTLSFELRDPCGNVQPELFVCIYNIIDDTAPSVTGGSIDGCYATEGDALAAAIAATTVSDNCTDTLDLEVNAVRTGSLCAATITVTVTDCAGNSNSVIYNTRIDGNGPTMTVSNIATCYATVAAAQAAAIAGTTIVDNCDAYGNLTITATTVGTCPATVTVTATDSCGNSNSVAYPGLCIGGASLIDITVDADDFSVDCNDWQTDLQAWLDDNGGAEATGSGIVWSYLPLDPATALEMSMPNCTTHSKSVVVTFRATNGCGSFDETTATFSVTDNTPPTANPIANTNLSCSSGIPTPNLELVTGKADNCGGAPSVALFSVSDNMAAGCPGNPRIIIHQYILTDAYCNTSIINHTITVVDNVAPTFTGPANITIHVDAACSFDASTANTGDVTDENDNCTASGPNLQAFYTDVINAGNGFQVQRVITRTWQLTDICGNTAIPRIQTITVVDDIAPSFLACPSNLTLPGSTIEGTCGAYFGGQTSPAFTDNCPGSQLSYSLSGVTNGTGIGAIPPTTVFLEGETTVTYTVTDAVGNTATCIFTVSVNCLSISGRIIWEHDGTSGVKDATVNVLNVAPTPAFSVSDLSDTNGFYEVTVPVDGTYRVRPVKNINRLNGVTAADATRITNHVNFSNPITNPYKKVCADVNRSGIINTQDATLITQSIAGNPTALAVFNVFWRFTPTDFVMPGTAHQNVPVFPESKDVSLVGLDAVNIDFYGMKIGDVADPWANPQNLQSPSPLVWVIQDQVLVAGTEVELNFTASNFNDLAAYQFALDFDPMQLEFVGFQPTGALALNLLDNFGAYNANLGELRNVWSAGTGVTLAEGTSVFRAKFKVLQSGQKLSQVLKLDDSAIECRAFNVALMPTEVKLAFTQSVSASTPVDLGKLQLELFQNRPNPFSDATTIGFIIPEACDAHIRILDISGRELTSYDRKYTAGYHELEFRMENAWSYGMLFCELVTPQGKRTIKMMTAK